MPVLECSRCNELYYSAHPDTGLACDACGGSVWRVFEDEVSFARVVEIGRELRRGDHAAVLYTDPEQAADFCAGFLRTGAARGERTVMLLPEGLRSRIEGRLPPGDFAALDRREPVGLHAGFDAGAAAERLRAIAGESQSPLRIASGPVVDPDSEAPVEEWRRYEWLAHELTLELRATALCVYDSASLPIAFPSVAIQTHPLVSRGGGTLRRNEGFAL